MKTTLLMMILASMGIVPYDGVRDSFYRDLTRGYDGSYELRATFDRDIYHSHHR